MDRTKDGKHLADGLAWNAFDARYPDFAADPCNVRLGLASDGFNPFRTMSATYSVWPVMLIPYNLSPWLCMKPPLFILSMIIPEEKGPGNDIDICLKLLVHELKQLCEGVDAYDAFTKEHFKLRVSLLWTINDFPAYANLSGRSTKGRVACPCCTNSTHSVWLKHGKKFSYMGHRKWLEASHPYHSQKDLFDGTIELGSPPSPPIGSDVLRQLQGTTFTYGKANATSKKRTREDVDSSVNESFMEDVNTDPDCYHDSIFEDADSFIDEHIDGEQQLWKKKSIFFIWRVGSIIF